MENIRRLPGAVCSSLRSAYLFDLTRIVEELMFNSIDAGSTMISVCVNVGGCHIEVDDNGCGVTREGLVLLGEKHATSKFCHVVDMDMDSESFASRGETLGSLSDVSLLEVITKARGRPNGYHKIIKGWKCLFLGINDHKKGTGTKVIVRDLFYNQPVRRRNLLSSPKKVLYSVKKCVIQVALVHPQVSFKLFDLQNDTDILSTISSPSPMYLIDTFFGNDVANSLRELNVSNETFKLSGYLSMPTFSSKAFQYLYINSRLVCKCPAHKLIDSLAAGHQFYITPQDVELELETWKRRKLQGFATYLLNLTCPSSSYDLTYEPSKTIAEFKHWADVLSFIEEAVKNFWIKTSAHLSEERSNINGNKPVDEDKIRKDGASSSDTARRSKTMSAKHNLPYCSNSISRCSLSFSFDASSEDLDDCLSKKSTEGVHKNIKETKECSDKFACSHHSDDYKNCDTQDIVFSENSWVDWQITSVSESKYDHNLCGGILRSNQSICGSEDVFLSSKQNYSNDLDDIFKDELFEKSVPNHVQDSKHQVLPISPRECLNLEPHSSLSLVSLAREGFLFNQREIIPKSNYLEIDSCFHPSVDGDAYSGHRGDSLFVGADAYCGKVVTYQHPFTMKKCKEKVDRDFFPGSLSAHHYDDSLHFEEETEHLFAEHVGDRLNEFSHKFSQTDWDCETENSLNSSKLYLPDHFMETHPLDKYIARDTTVGGAGEYSTCSRTRRKFCEGIPDLSSKASKHGKELLVGPKRKLYMYSLGDSDHDHLNVDMDCYDHDISVAADACNFDSYVPSIDQQYHTAFKSRSRRSQSAPPFYKQKKKFPVARNDSKQDSNVQSVHNGPIETGLIFKEFPIPHLDGGQSLNECSPSYSGIVSGEKSYFCETTGLQCIEKCDKVNFPFSHSDNKDISTIKLDGPDSVITKWRVGDSEVESMPNNISNCKDDILDISSGLLNLSGSFLLPETINKVSLGDAKVLLQLDKKFIPIVARGTLAVIDQHAADERIRLEEMREKVLSGEGNRVTYLDSEQELVLPEMGFQLLQNYAEQIQKWGWICNIYSQCTDPFSKNLSILKRQPDRATLVAVPCILGVNLTERDLIEFLQQLAETDGSSAIPPSVNRVLNFKACRGAIMFGDSLLPSECSLIVDELKATSLCFQCAHGRPTTIPLVNMGELHKELARLELQNRPKNELWHGFRKQKPTIARAQLRLSSANKFRSSYEY